MDVWEKNARKLRRQAELRRIDDWFIDFYAHHPYAFHLLTIVFAGALFVIAFGLERLIEQIFG